MHAGTVEGLLRSQSDPAASLVQVVLDYGSVVIANTMMVSTGTLQYHFHCYPRTSLIALVASIVVTT